MENMSDVLMLTGTVAQCPDCGDERILMPVDPDGGVEFCCTSCDAAVVVLDQVVAVDRFTRLAS